MSAKTQRRRKQANRFRNATKWSAIRSQPKSRPPQSLTGDGVTVHKIEIVGAPMDDRDEAWERFLGEDGDAWERMEADLMGGEYDRHTDDLERLIEKHPDAKKLYTFLATAYEQAGRYDDATELVKAMYALFPDYLFARANYATHCLAEGRADEVPAVMNHQSELALYDRSRQRFHVSEVIAFYSVWAMYWDEVGEHGRAEAVYDMLAQIAPEHRKVLSLNAYRRRASERLRALFRKACRGG